VRETVIRRIKQHEKRDPEAPKQNNHKPKKNNNPTQKKKKQQKKKKKIERAQLL